MDKHLLDKAIKASLIAGEQILIVYENGTSIKIKEDSSPLTEADTASNTAIKIALGEDIPILSEEGKMISFEERKDWDIFWLIDPLDGTKEFIKRNGEFTVNIALIQQGKPILGVVYVPVTGKLYFGMENLGSYSIMMDDHTRSLNLEELIQSATELNSATLPEKFIIVASRSHMSPETEQFIEEKRVKYGEVDLISSGSSLKLCLVAEGAAHVYPRLAPTMEWDTAAAQAVANFAGCRVYNYETGKDLEYNKENLLNPWFVVERS